MHSIGPLGTNATHPCGCVAGAAGEEVGRSGALDGCRHYEGNSHHCGKTASGTK
jgi:hypothetical protein